MELAASNMHENVDQMNQGFHICVMCAFIFLSCLFLVLFSSMISVAWTAISGMLRLNLACTIGQMDFDKGQLVPMV